MRQISAAVEPSLTIMVLDGAIGQAAESQSRAFKEAAGYGAMIVTKMDGHAKGGGAISAVAATKTPIAFIGVGEHIQDLERFDPRSFVSQLLGMGDVHGFMEKMEDARAAAAAKTPGAPKTKEEQMQKLASGKFSLRDFRQQMDTMAGMGPLSKMASMIPGMGAGQRPADDESAKMIKKSLCMMEAMTPTELDSDGSMFFDEPSKLPEGQPRPPNARILRIARGSGTKVGEVEQMLGQFHSA